MGEVSNLPDTDLYLLEGGEHGGFVVTALEGRDNLSGENSIKTLVVENMSPTICFEISSGF
jgi:hypothetical protein